MRKVTLLIGLLILTTSMSGCMTSIDGTYIHEDDPSKYLILGADRTYFVHQENAFGGDYRIIDEDLYLLIPHGSLMLKRDGNIWIDADGDRWVGK